MVKGDTSTALIAINAVGNAAPPMIIHKGKYMGKDWKNGAPQDTLVRVSDKGYINKELFVEFGKLFIRHLKRQELIDGRPHLLILDCHYSHLYNLQFLELMKEHSITYCLCFASITYCLCFATSHQSLDAVIGPRDF